MATKFGNYILIMLIMFYKMFLKFTFEQGIKRIWTEISSNWCRREVVVLFPLILSCVLWFSELETGVTRFIIVSTIYFFSVILVGYYCVSRYLTGKEVGTNSSNPEDPAETLNSVNAIENLMLQIEVEEDGLKLFEQQLKITKEFEDALNFQIQGITNSYEEFRRKYLHHIHKLKDINSKYQTQKQDVFSNLLELTNKKQFQLVDHQKAFSRFIAELERAI